MRSVFTFSLVILLLSFAFGPSALAAENCDFRFSYAGESYCSGSLSEAIAEAKSILPPPSQDLELVGTTQNSSNTTYHLRTPESVPAEDVLPGFDAEFLLSDTCPNSTCTSFSQAEMSITQVAESYAVAHRYCFGGVRQTGVQPLNTYSKGGETGPSGSGGYDYFLKVSRASLLASMERIPGNPNCDGGYHWKNDMPASIESMNFYYCPEGYRAYVADNNSSAYCKGGGGIDIVGRVAPQSCNDCSLDEKGNPINLPTGNKHETEVDYSAGGLTLTRHYHSARVFDSGHLGAGWMHNYDQRVVFQAPGDPTSGVKQYVAPNGYVYAIGNYSPGAIQVPGLEETMLSFNSSNGLWELIEGQKRTIFNSDGRLLRIENVGSAIHASYDEQGKLSKVETDYGRSLQFNYSNNTLVSVTLPDASFISYAYDDGRLVSATYPDSSTRQYHYENSLRDWLLTGVTDELQVRYSTFEYDANGMSISTQLAGGVNRYDVERLADGTVSLTNPAGEEVSVTYTVGWNQRRFSSASTASGEMASFSIQARTTDPSGYETGHTDLNGVTTSITRDSYGRETSRTVAVGTPQERTTSRSVDFWTGLVNSVTRPGQTVSYTYDGDRNRLTETVTDTDTSETRTTTWTYNASGQVLTIDGPRTDVSDVTTYTYDSFGNLATVTNALGHLTQYTSYDAHGNPLEIIDPNGIITKLAYDPRQRLVSRTVAFGTPSAATTLFDYDPAAQLEKTTLPDGSWISYEYDAAHRMTAIEDGAGNRIDYVLDAMGNRIEETVTGPGGAVFSETFRDYNTLNRLVSEYGPEGSTASYGYDAEGKRTTITDAANNVTTNRYDALDRLFETIDALSGVTSYAYDARDNLTQVVDPRGVTTGYTYNGFNELTETDSPDAGITSYAYDKAGNRTSQTDARGITTSFTYDALNRLTFIDYPGTDQDITYTYDGGASGCANCIGRLTRIDDETGYTTYSYDARGNLVNKLSVVETATGQQFLPVGYGYDAADNLTSLSYPSGDLVQYQRNASGRITGLTLTKAGGTPMNLVTNIQHAPFGPVAALTFGNGIAESRSFDQEGRISRIQSTALDLGYTWSTTGNITAIADNLDATRTQSFNYDAFYRLTDASGIYGDLAYGYDAVGNRETQTATPPSGTPDTTTYTYAATSNRLSTITDASGTTTYQYDANGNTTDNGDHAFAYDDRNRLATADITNSYAHNALGQRVTKTTSAGTVLFVYDEAGHLLGEYDALGNAIRQYVWLNDRPVAMLKKSGATTDVYYIHSDHLNTPQVVTNENQSVVWKADYKPFGEAEPTVTTLDMPLRFPGQIFDSETNLSYNYFRTYDPRIGRYGQNDPIGLSGGLNRYTYVKVNPISRFDQYGLFDAVNPADYPNLDPGDGGVFCDGRGGFRVWVPNDWDECIRDCVVQHENMHLNHIYTKNQQSICSGKTADHRIVASTQEERLWTERIAYQTEKRCLQRKLDAIECGDACENRIRNRILFVDGKLNQEDF